MSQSWNSGLEHSFYSAGTNVTPKTLQWEGRKEDVCEYSPMGAGMQTFGIHCKFKIMLLFFNGSSRENIKDLIQFSPSHCLPPPSCQRILVAQSFKKKIKNNSEGEMATAPGDK